RRHGPVRAGVVDAGIVRADVLVVAVTRRLAAVRVGRRLVLTDRRALHVGAGVRGAEELVGAAVRGARGARAAGAGAAHRAGVVVATRRRVVRVVAARECPTHGAMDAFVVRALVVVVAVDLARPDAGAARAVVDRRADVVVVAGVVVVDVLASLLRIAA